MRYGRAAVNLALLVTVVALGSRAVGRPATTGLRALVVPAVPGVSPRAYPAMRAMATGGQPVVNVAAFRGQGHLAFLWNKALYVLDGTAGVLRRLTAASRAPTFAWSPDGRWLAYDTGNGQLWLVRVDGSGRHRVTGLPAPVASSGWLPSTDVLSITLSGDALWLIDTHGGAPSRIVGPFPGTPDLFGYYGHASWPIVAAWNRH